jgi:hypothetical protein
MDIDLNIFNYSIDDLKKFLNLNNTFDENILNKKKMELYDKINISENVNNEFKMNFSDFLNDATNILIKSLHAEDTIIHNKLDNTEINPTHPIVHIPKEPFVYVQSSQAFQGVVNPLERRIITKLLSIDSVFRSNPTTTTSNNFVFQLQTPLHNVISMKLVALELPRLWYSISSQLLNNSFKITLKNMALFPDTFIIITLPDGNYSNSELISAITNYFNNSTNGLTALNFTINSVTGKSIFYVNSEIYTNIPVNTSYSPNFYYELDFSEQYSGFGSYIGFNKPYYKATSAEIYSDLFFSSVPTIYYGYLTGESSCGLVDNYIFVIVNDYNYNHETNTISSQTHNGFIGDDVLGRITLDISPDNLLINNPSDKIFKTRDYFGPVRIRQLEIKLINKYNKIIDLLNNNFSLALEFQILYSP